MKSLAIILYVLLIYSCTDSTNTYEEAIKFCSENKEVLQKVVGDNEITGIMITSKSCIEGYQLPDFSIETIDGEIISTESLKGKLSIINFWFESCPPCIAEIPGLNQIRAEFGTESVNYLAISTDRKSDVVAFLENKEFNFMHIADGDAIYRETFAGKWGFPFTIITNRQNVIVKSFGGGPTDSTAVEAIINKIRPVLMQEKVDGK